MTPPALPPITEDDIADYLANTPDFFERHAGLLAAVQLTSPHGNRAVSLQERQAGLLREKIKAMEHKAAEMIRHGHENTAIADKLQRWTRELLRTREDRELPRVVADELAALFVVPQVAIRIWGLLPEYADAPFAQGVNEEAQAFASALTRPYCGPSRDLEVVQWLPDPAAVQSLALVPLRAGLAPNAFGLLVLASADAQRFTADMGTDFLERISDIASAALSRLRPVVPPEVV
jgi:uncharacterized protein YigA (DUF484 family)